MAEVLSLASRNGRICPRPAQWSTFYDRLPDKRLDAYGQIPPPALILADWDLASDEQKRMRFNEHLEWAAAHGSLDRVYSWLDALAESEWHHAGE